MTPALFLLAYALGLLTAGLWACAWWKCKQLRIVRLLTDEAGARVYAMRARTAEDAAYRCEAWMVASERLEREVAS